MHYLIAIVAFGLLIAFHESGHFIAARMLGIRVSRFSLGFGPAILSIRGKNTEYRLGAVPLGGYVRIYGMNPHEAPDTSADKRSFSVQKPWKRIVLLASGSVANYLLAIAALSWLYASGTRVPVPMTIGTVEPGSMAARAQLRPGDRIATINGTAIDSWEDFLDLFAEKSDAGASLLIVRHGEPMQVAIKAEPQRADAGNVGITQQLVFQKHPLGQAVRLGFQHANGVAVDGFATPARWLRGRRGIELGSTLGIIEGTSGGLGLDFFLRLLAVISVALAVFNLLPIPALDGGRLLFVAIESVTGKPVNPKLETLLHTVGFLALLGLLLLLAYRDLRRFFP